MMVPDLLKFLLVLGLMHQAHGQSRKQVLTLFKDKLSRDVYNPRVRPVKNSSDTTIVTVDIVLDSIFNVDMDSQKIRFSESLSFSWTDEFLTWNPEDYGGAEVIEPHPQQIWRPLVYSVPHVTKNEPIADVQGQVTVNYEGLVIWKPKSLPIRANCVEDFFDQMDCEVQLASKIHPTNELVFVLKKDRTEKTQDTWEVGWKVIQNSVTTINKTLGSSNQSFSTVQFDFTIRRLFTIVDLILVLLMAFFSFLCVIALAFSTEQNTKLGTAILLTFVHGCFLRATSYYLPNLASLMSVPVSIFVGAILVKYVAVACERDRRKKKLLKAGKRKADFRTTETKSPKTAERNGEDFKDDATPSINTEPSDKNNNNNKIKIYKTIADKFYWVAAFIFCASWVFAVVFVKFEADF